MTKVTAKAAEAIETKTAETRDPGRMHPPRGRGTTRARIQEPRPVRLRSPDAGYGETGRWWDLVPARGLSESEIYFSGCTARSAPRHTFDQRAGSAYRGYSCRVRSPRS